MHTYVCMVTCASSAKLLRNQCPGIAWPTVFVASASSLGPSLTTCKFVGCSAGRQKDTWDPMRWDEMGSIMGWARI